MQCFSILRFNSIFLCPLDLDSALVSLRPQYRKHPPSCVTHHVRSLKEALHSANENTAYQDTGQRKNGVIIMRCQGSTIYTILWHLWVQASWFMSTNVSTEDSLHNTPTPSWWMILWHLTSMGEYKFVLLFWSGCSSKNLKNSLETLYCVILNDNIRYCAIEWQCPCIVIVSFSNDSLIIPPFIISPSSSYC